MTPRTLVWSCGGGLQSAAIAVLVREGVLPRPDLSVIVDTGREVSSTWQYLHEVLTPYLEPVGVKIEIAPHSLARVDLYDKDGLTLMPAYTQEGRKAAFCSGEWKRDVAERWLRQKGVKECDQWIGYSFDELWRVKKDHRPWCHLQFPLVDMCINRAMCAALVERAIGVLPRKSRCWQCPHQTPEEWMEVRANPEEWAAAVRLDHEIREKDPKGEGLYLYSGRVPLEMADFGKDAGPIPPGRPCETGNCWT